MPELEDIYRFYQIDAHLATGGQPKAEQFSAIKKAGYSLVINLADGSTEHDIDNEANIVIDLGMRYHNIPVDWEHPTEEDIENFFSFMDENSHEKIFVHCIANYRVSAFVMLYRVLKQGIPLDEAQATKDKVWKPERVFPKWDALIVQILSRYGNENI